MAKKLSLLFAIVFVSVTKCFSETKDIVTFHQKGSTEVALAVSSIGIVNNTIGLFNVTQLFLDVSSGTPTAMANIAFSTGNMTVSSSVIVALSTGNFVQLRYPRRLTLQAKFDVGFSTAVSKSTVTFSGVDSRGSERRESILVSSAVSLSGFAYTRITSFTVGAIESSTKIAAADTLFIQVGTTNTIGLSNTISLASDLYAANESGVFLSSQTVNLSANGIQPATLPNGITDYEYSYRVRKFVPKILNSDR